MMYSYSEFLALLQLALDKGDITDLTIENNLVFFKIADCSVTSAGVFMKDEYEFSDVMEDIDDALIFDRDDLIAGMFGDYDFYDYGDYIVGCYNLSEDYIIKGDLD